MTRPGVGPGPSTAAALILLGLALPTPTSAQVTDPPTPLERYVRAGLEANLGLLREELAAEQADARWTERRRERLPSLELEARYTRADGGRTIDIPTGDLVNPVHRALNRILENRGEPGTFPTVENQSIPLLREEEQETRLRVTQVLWNPALNADIRSRRALARAGTAAVDAARRTLIRDIRVAYYRYANAARAVEILDAAVAMVRENERSTTALRQAALVTPDRVHRARAERLEVQEERDRAVAERENAAAFLNLLLDRDTDAPVETSPRDLTLEVGPAAGPGLDRARVSWADTAVAHRPELRQRDHAVAAAVAGVDAVRGATLPSLALAVEAGLQGRDYDLGPEARFVTASLVLRWPITAGRAESARMREARLERDRQDALRHETARHLRLEAETAARNARVALGNLSSARERVTAARSAFRLVSRRRDEGLATLLELLDARSALTRAELGRSITETEALIRLAELDHATGSPAGDLDITDPDAPEATP